MYVDAGPHGIGAVLTQVDEKDNRWLIACGSHAFSDIEKRFSQVEKETLAPVWACLYFKYYLLGNNNFTIKTDNQSVAIILSKNSKPKPTTSLRILSWISKIIGYNYKIEHITSLEPPTWLITCHVATTQLKQSNLMI